jgi:uncharacterized membrane protein YfcA
MDLLTLSLALTLAALIGLSLGLLGSGGSIITLPVLVYVARIPTVRSGVMGYTSEHYVLEECDHYGRD